jgi:hypothetical protein
VPACYVMYERMQLTFRVVNDNLDLGWTTNGWCLLRSMILDEREPYDTGIGDILQPNFKPIGLIVSPPIINIYIAVRFAKVYQTIVTSLLQHTKQEFSIYLCIYIYLRIFQRHFSDIQRQGFLVMPSEAATSYFHQGSTITYPNLAVIDLRIPCKGNIEGASGYVSIS